MVTGILCAILLPILVGWWYGKDHIDPETYKGRYYYNSSTKD